MPLNNRLDIQEAVFGNVGFSKFLISLVVVYLSLGYEQGLKKF